MNKHDNGRQVPDPSHLLGGYASGSLTPEEQKLLFEAALRDGPLFEELMKEQALKEALEQPGVRRELIDALQPAPGLLARMRKWMGSPVAWSAAGAMAATVAVVLFVGRGPKPAPVAQAPVAKERAADVAVMAPQQQAELRVLEDAPREAPREAPKPAAARKAAPMPSRPEAVAATAAPELPQAPAVGAVAGNAMPRAMEVAVPAAAPPPPAAAPMAADSVAELKKVAPPAPVQPIVYGLLRGDLEGVFRPVGTPRELGDSDRFKITVTPNEDGVLTVSRVNRDRTVTRLARMRARGGATVILPAEESIRVSEVETLVLEFGDGLAEEGEARQMFGFRGPAGALRARQSKERAAAQPVEKAKAEEAGPRNVRIEIPIRRR